MKTRWSKLVELRRRALEEAEQALGRAHQELARARHALAGAREIEARTARDRDLALARGVVEREWAEMEAWLADKRAATHGSAAAVLAKESGVSNALALVQERSLEVFRLEALETRERDLVRRAEARSERAAEDDRASIKHGRTSAR